MRLRGSDQGPNKQMFLQDLLKGKGRLTDQALYFSSKGPNLQDVLKEH